MSYTKILDYLRIICFIILFSWISFFPAPLHDKYQLAIRIFYCLFLFILFLDKDCRKNLFSMQDWPLWVFLASLFAGTINATNKPVAFHTYFYLVITLFFVFYIGKGIFLKEKDRKAVIVTICICSCFVAIIGFVELFFHKNILYEGLIQNPYYERYVGSRMMSTQFNPAVLGTYFLATIPFIFSLLNSNSIYLRLLSLVFIPLSISAMIFTFSRGIFLGFISLMSFYLWKTQRRKTILLFSICLILFIAICSLWVPPEFQRLGFYKLILGETSIISEYRINRINMAFKMLKDHPLCGVGLGNFRIRFFEYNYDVDEKTLSYEFMIPDNMYLSFLSETGIIGTLGLLVFIIFLVRGIFIRFQGIQRHLKQQTLLIILHSSLVGLLMNMAAYDLFYWSNPYILFSLIGGFIEGRKYDK